jgi:hypothetical protein
MKRTKRTMRRRTTTIGGIKYTNEFTPWANPKISEDVDNRLAQIHAMRGTQRQTLPCGCEGEEIQEDEFVRRCPSCNTSWLERPDY